MTNNHPSFFFIANNLAIDFVNTCIQKNGAPYELLNTSADLLLWASAADIKLQASISDIELDSALQFRQRLKNLFDAKYAEQVLPNTALATLNTHLSNAPLQQRLTQQHPLVSLQPLADNWSLSDMLGEIAHQAAQILCSSNKQPIKSCASEQCILLFLDTSKAKKRRWCSMEHCGNRAKAATFYKGTKA